MKALALFSGGLDSVLSVKIIKNQGIEVIALYIDTGFGSREDKTELLKEICKSIGVDLIIKNIRSQFIEEILFKPKYGYGKNFNPCIDCHANMFRQAKIIMEEVGASFLISGEVLGQRPMSQRLQAMKNVEKLSGAKGLILRPLSAKLLDITKPEIENWVDREKLYGISGRSRDMQMKLAEEYGLENYESPAGGCLLTDRHFSNKLREFIKYEELKVPDIELLKFGRHFRLPNGAKLIIGRDFNDNTLLEKNINSNYLPVIIPITGPYSLINRSADKKDKNLAAKLAITYAKSNIGETYTVRIGENDIYNVLPFEKKETGKTYLI